MSYKVIQWSTGNVGSFSLRAIIGHPELELVGVACHSPAKNGKDAGALCGVADVGIKATSDHDSLLALGADCVCYTASADVRQFEAVEDICRILSSGANVVSSSVVGLVHPTSLDPSITKDIQAACKQGNSSFLTSGIDPGFANDLLPLVLSGLSERWRQIRIMEVINYATYDQPQVLFDIMGFGGSMDDVPMLLQPGILSFAWGGTIRLLAEGLGLELDEIREVHERRAATKAIPILGRQVEVGTQAAMRFEVQGIVDGREALVVEHVTRLDDDLAPEWPSGNGSYRIVVEGVPRIQCELEMEDEHGDHAVGGVVLTATRLVNAIPSVCQAASGPLSALDLPLITGRGLMDAGDKPGDQQ